MIYYFDHGSDDGIDTFLLDYSFYGYGSKANKRAVIVMRAIFQCCGR